MEAAIMNRDIRRQVDSDLKQFAENWIWRAIHCLVSSPDFESSPKWAARRLNVSVEKVVEAFEGLERLGQIRRNGNSYEDRSEYIVERGTLSSEDALAIHAKLAPQIIAKLDTNSRFVTHFMLGSEELVKEYAPKFYALLDEMSQKGLASKTSNVTAIEISFANLTAAVGGQK